MINFLRNIKLLWCHTLYSMYTGDVKPYLQYSNYTSKYGLVDLMGERKKK